MHPRDDSAMSLPCLVYDDDCGFCTRAALYVADRGPVELVAFSALPEEARDRLPEDWQDCAHFVTETTVYSCGEAMERAYESTGRPTGSALSVLRRVPGYELVRELVYGWIASHRPLVGRVTRRLR